MAARSAVASTSARTLGTAIRPCSASRLCSRTFATSSSRQEELESSDAAEPVDRPAGRSRFVIDPFAEADQAEANAQRLRRRQRNALSHLSELGSTQTRQNVWHPTDTRNKPPTAREVTVSHLLAATAQVGHNTGRIARAYQPWIYGVRHGIAQIDVERATLPALRRASRVVKDVVKNDGVVLIVGTHKDIAGAVVAASRRMGPHGYHVSVDRWMPGVLTNASKLLARAVMASMDDYLVQHAELRESQSSSSPLQTENVAAASSPGEAAPSSQVPEDDATPSGAKLASQLLQPDLVVVLDPKSNLFAIREATQLNIPTIGIVDTDVDPRIVTYPIPANDESLRVQELVVGVLSKAGQEGWREREQMTEAWERAEYRKRQQQERE